MNILADFLLSYFWIPSIIPLVLFGMYLIAKRYPRFSRELHKHNCKCNVCYPMTKSQSGKREDEK